MYIDYPETLTADSFTERDLYDELLEIDSELDRQLAIDKVRAIAKKFGLATAFNDNMKAAKKEFAKIQKRELANTSEMFGACMTDFSLRDQTGGQFNCGDWIADDDGVRLHSDRGLQWACSHPIFISKILRNVETGKYKAEIVYKLPERTVRTIYVDRKVLASASKILDIADDGVIVTSITAPLLVKYLADLQTLNPELIDEKPSTGRLGWIDGVDAEGNPIKQFLPYQSDIIFDNAEMMSLFNSIKPHGDRDKWYKLVKDIRKKKQPEVLINLAASFASVLLEPCGAMPFIVSLWGETGIGKSVILKLCTSIWADPKDGRYITDPKATATALEIRLHILNSLPMTIDDMAQITMQSDEDFSKMIYYWCAGKGRDRATKELGLRGLAHWKNCTITNSERSMVDESMQGGAINRVIDIEASGPLFNGESGNKTVMTVENNYGWAGEEFIDHITELGFDEIKAIYNEQYARIKEVAKEKGVEKEDKQVMPMALILTADYLSEKYLFCDGIRINIDHAVNCLRSKGEISENKSAYEYLIDTIVANSFKFDDDAELRTERWGFWKDEETVVINRTKFEAIMKTGGYQGKSFLSWAKRKGLIECDSKGNPTKPVSHDGMKFRGVVIKTTYDGGEESAILGTFADELEPVPFK